MWELLNSRCYFAKKTLLNLLAKICMSRGAVLKIEVGKPKKWGTFGAKTAP